MSKEKIPKKITVNFMTKKVKAGEFPNIYPDQTFLKEHYQIIEPYLTEILLYKGACYKELNTYYKTGEIIMQGGCGSAQLTQVATKVGKTGLSAEEKVKLVADRLKELYSKVKPLPYDIIVYRGVKIGTIGQNMFTGECIKTRLYNLDMHRFCIDPDLGDIKLYKDRKNGDPRRYIYETLGFVSTTSRIGTALGFSETADNNYDTVMAFRLPKGTKFIMPINKDAYSGRYIDYEYEFILFPKHCTFIVNNIENVKLKKYSTNKYPLYIGTFCNTLNKYRPKNSPILRALRVKILNPDDWYDQQAKSRPLFSYVGGACKNKNCHQYLHFCDPSTGKCLGNKLENITKIKEWWKQTSIKGKCNSGVVDKCLDKHLPCDPETGKCLTQTDIAKYGHYSWSNLIDKRVINWVAPKDIAGKQKPRYKCTEAKIKKCVKDSQLCEINTGNCISYTEEQLWVANNGLSTDELSQFVPSGKCTEKVIKECASLDRYCNPVTSECKKQQDSANFKKLLAVQTPAAKKKYAKQKKKEQAEKEKKATELAAKQKPRYKCDAALIKKCALKGQLCHPVHKHQDCLDYNTDEDLYYANNVVDKAELRALEPYGACDKAQITECADENSFCDPEFGVCLEFNSMYDARVKEFQKELEKQKA